MVWVNNIFAFVRSSACLLRDDTERDLFVVTVLCLVSVCFGFLTRIESGFVKNSSKFID